MGKVNYATCAKCGLKHSTLVRHKCAKPKPLAKRAEDEAIDLDYEKTDDVTESLDRHEGVPNGGADGDDGEQGGEAEGEAEGEGEGSGEGDSKGEANGDGDGESEGGQGEGSGDPSDGEAEGEGKAEGGADGDGEGEGAEGETEGDGEGDSAGQPPEPQMPEPETPIVQVICTVLKFAALTAQCAKNGTIEITVQEQGLMVYGHNGDLWAMDTMAWKDFEDRSTIDGEFYVKEVIDGVDAKLLPPPPEPDKDEPEAPARDYAAEVKRLMEEHKKNPPKKEPKAKKAKAETPKVPTLTLPMFVGQRVMCRDGKVRTVEEIRNVSNIAVIGGEYKWAKNANPELVGRGSQSAEFPTDALHDAEEALTLPLTVGQKVLVRDGQTAEVIADADRILHRDYREDAPCVRVKLADGNDWNYYGDTGHFVRDNRELDEPHQWDIVADQEVREAEGRKLTVPMFVGQKVMCRDGKVRTVGRVASGAAYYKGKPEHAVFANNDAYRTHDVAGLGNGTKGAERTWDALHDAE